MDEPGEEFDLIEHAPCQKCGKPTLNIYCGDCEEQFEEAGS